MDLYRYNYPEKKDKYEPLVLSAIEADAANTAGYYSNLTDFFASGGNWDKARTYYVEVEKLDAQTAQALAEDYPRLIASK